MNTRLHLVRAAFAHISRLNHLVIATVLAVSFLGAPTVQAQSNVNGYIFGSVSGAVANSKIIATDAGSGIRREATPDSTGSYRITSLPLGSYTVTLQAPGQADQTLDNVSVNLGTGSSVNFSGVSDGCSSDRATRIPITPSLLTVKFTAASSAVSDVMRSIDRIPSFARKMKRVSSLRTGLFV